jgi:hypothetical protein
MAIWPKAFRQDFREMTFGSRGWRERKFSRQIRTPEDLTRLRQKTFETSREVRIRDGECGEKKIFDSASDLCSQH